MGNTKTTIPGILYETFRHLSSFLRWIGLCLVILYLLSGFYSISSNEIGILQRFGKVLDDKVQPGMHYALPWPVDCVIKVPIRTVERLLIDDFYLIERNSAAWVFSSMTGLDSYCLTGDNNLVNVQCVIQFTVTNPFDYLFRAKDQNIMLRSLACSTIIHCLAKMPIDEALTRGKQGIAYFVKLELQKRLDAVRSGLSVSFVELGDLRPPNRVEQFFSDVVKAKIDREKMVNDAESYRNERIPAAQADANRIVQEAGAYKTEVVLRAEGETDRFIRLLERVGVTGSFARKMIYIETMKEIMKNVGEKLFVFSSEDGKVPARLKLFRPQ